MENIEIGTVVHLKSDTLPMTVTKVGNGHAVCEWHDNNGLPLKETYPLKALDVFNIDANLDLEVNTHSGD